MSAAGAITIADADVLDVCRSMVREALAGNTSAGRLVLEHSGKLQKNIHITISSPFEQYLESQERKKIETSEEISSCNDGSLIDANWIEDAEMIGDKKSPQFPEG